MNTPRPPMEPLDSDERELARILRALPGGEPPPALDAAILRAATNAAAASKRPGARFLASAGALWGIGSAAAAVLALGVAWEMKYGGDHAALRAEHAPRAQSVSDVAEDESVQVELGTQAADAPFVPPPPPPAMAQNQAPARAAPVRPVRQEAPAPAAAAAPAAEPEAFAQDRLDEHVAREAAAAAELKAETESRDRASNRAESAAGIVAAKSAAANAAPAMQAAAPAPPAADAAAATASRADAGTVGALSSAVGGQAEAQEEQPAKKPATWLAEIRKLRDQGQIEQARARLVEFHKTYPKWVIPTDLAPLLSE